MIQTVFDLPLAEVHELLPGQSIVVKRNGKMKLTPIHLADSVTPCSGLNGFTFQGGAIVIFTGNVRNWDVC